MEKNSKVFSYIGFAIKSGKCKTGENTLATVKGANLIIVCKTASDNAVDRAKSYAKKFRCPILQTREKRLEEYLFKEKFKVMAITDKSLAKAILLSAEEDFIKLEVIEDK